MVVLCLKWYGFIKELEQTRIESLLHRCSAFILLYVQRSAWVAAFCESFSFSLSPLVMTLDSSFILATVGTGILFSVEF